MTLRDYQAKYENFVRIHLRPQTWERYARVLTKLVEHFGDRHPKDIFRIDVIGYITKRAKEGAGYRTLALERMVGATFYRWLAENEIVEEDHNPFNRAKVPGREPEFVRRALSKETIYALWNATKTDEEKLIVQIANSTPLSAGMIATLKKEDFDFERKRLVVQRGKNRRVVVLPVEQNLLDVVANHPDGYLFPHHAKQFQPGTSLGKTFKNIVNRAGVHASVHCFRHTYATDAIQSGIDLRTVQALLGHANIETTSRYLAPADVETVRNFLGTRLPLR